MAGQDLAARGTAVRSRRATLKQAIASGAIDLVALLYGDADESHEQIALEIRVGELLRSVPDVGREGAAAIATAADVPGDATLMTLTTARRHELAGALRERTRR